MAKKSESEVAAGSGDSPDVVGAIVKAERRVLFDTMLKCTLTGTELVERARGMASMQARIESLEKELKAVTVTLKGKIGVAQSEMSIMGLAVQNGWEMRTVECVRLFDYEKGRVRELRLDNDVNSPAVIEDRRMTDSERQEMLPLDA